MKKRFIFVFVLVVVFMLVFSACGSSGTKSGDSSSGASGEKGRIAFINYVNAHPYFTHAKQAAIDEGKELGYEVIYDGPADVDTPKFVSMIEDYTSQGVKAIVAAPLDDSCANALKAARDKGIKVITWDIDLEDTSARDVYTGMGDYVPFTGSGIAESLVANIGEEGKYVLIDGEPSMTIIMDRGDFIIDYLKDKYPKLECLAREAAGEDPQKAYTIAQNLLTAFPDINAILVNTSSASVVSCNAVEEFGLVGKVWVAGESFSDMAPSAFEIGASKAFYTWDTAEWSSFAVMVAAKLIEGEDIPQGDNIGFPKFPKATRTGDDIFYNSDFVFLTPENIAQYE